MKGSERLGTGESERMILESLRGCDVSKGVSHGDKGIGDPEADIWGGISSGDNVAVMVWRKRCGVHGSSEVMVKIS